MADDARSLYTVLGITEGASGPEIRIAYLNLARSLHPDRQQGRAPAELALAERRMREVNDAYAVLGDLARRRAYDDEQRAARRASTAASRPRPGTGTGTGTGTSGGARPSAARPPSGPRPDNVERFDADPAWRSHLGPDDLDDGVEVTPVVAFLLRRGPLLAVLVLAALLFISTAYAGAPDDPATTTTTTAPCTPSIVTGVSGGSVVPAPC